MPKNLYKRFPNIAIEPKSKLPMDITDSYWMYAHVIHSHYPEPHLENNGKWLVFKEYQYLNDMWLNVLQALNDNLLGRGMKSSTSLYNPHAPNDYEGVICVYTYNYENVEDVMRIRQALRDIGVTWKIPYKTDVNIGKYSKDGFRTSLFYE